MLGDLANQRLAIGLWHLVARLDALVSCQQLVKGRALRKDAEQTTAAAATAASSIAPDSAAFNGSSGSMKSLPSIGISMATSCALRQSCRLGVAAARMGGWLRAPRPQPSALGSP